MEPNLPEHPFTVRRLGGNALLVRFDRELTLTEAHVDALYAAVLAEMGGEPFALLVEKTRRDSFSLGALRRLLEQPRLFALAFFLGGDAQPFAVEVALAVTAPARRFPAELFRNRTDAIHWLAQHGADVEPAQRPGKH